MSSAHQDHGQSSDGCNGLSCLGVGNDRANKKTNGLGCQQTQQDSSPVGKKGSSIVPVATALMQDASDAHIAKDCMCSSSDAHCNCHTHTQQQQCA